MKMSKRNILLGVIILFFVALCFHSTFEGFGLTSGAPSAIPSTGVSETDIVEPEEVEEETDLLKLIPDRIFNTQSNSNYIKAIVEKDENGGVIKEELKLHIVNSAGTDTEVYDLDGITVNELGKTKVYMTADGNAKMELVIQGGESTGILLYKNGGRTLFTSNQYEHYGSSNPVSTTTTSTDTATTTSTDTATTTSTDTATSTSTSTDTAEPETSYDELLSQYDNSVIHTTSYGLDTNPNYILKSKIVPPVQPKNPYLMDNLDDITVFNNLLPNETDLDIATKEETDKSEDKKETRLNILNKLKSFLNLDEDEIDIDSELTSESDKLSTLEKTKYAQAYEHLITKNTKTSEETQHNRNNCTSCCNKCPESAYECKPKPNFSYSNGDLPRPVINSFSTFGM